MASLVARLVLLNSSGNTRRGDLAARGNFGWKADCTRTIESMSCNHLDEPSPQKQADRVATCCQWARTPPRFGADVPYADGVVPAVAPGPLAEYTLDPPK